MALVNIVTETVLNLTQHAPTEEQAHDGVINTVAQTAVKELLTFNEIPSLSEMEERANKLVDIVVESVTCIWYGPEEPEDALTFFRTTDTKVLIGGAPFFMSTLERVLKLNGITPMYAFSARDSVETVLEDGTVRKVNTFKHLGFVEV